MNKYAKISPDGTVADICIGDFQWPTTGLPDLWVLCPDTTKIGDRYDTATQAFIGV